MATLRARRAASILDHGTHGNREDHHDRGDDRPHQPHASGAHRHGRGPDRGRPRRPALDRAAAGDRHRHRLVRGRAPARDPSGPRRDLHRRDPGLRVGAGGIQAAETGHRDLDPPHDRRDGDDQPRPGPLPAGATARDPLVVRRRARGIVSQRLVGRADGKGRVPVVEVLINTGRVFDGSSIPTRPPASSRRSPTATSTGCRRSTKRS